MPYRFLYRRNQVDEHIGVEAVRFALHDRGEAFESKAGVNRRLGQRYQRFVWLHPKPETKRRPRLWRIDIFNRRMPDPFRAVGLWYRNFDQTSDEEVCRLLGFGA